jgi:2-polyprenyl-3-methyl-5-hydroxy-6-metoxy-1,4-benzoquinol methylase
MSQNEYTYQLGYSDYFARYQYDPERQDVKARKVLAVLEDYYGGPGSLSELSLLDIGCSAGLMTRLYAEEFRSVTGIDIDAPAVAHASRNFSSERVRFSLRDAMQTGLDDETFDAVTCTHIYEHVPDYHRLMAEIYRVLKKGGVCYFAAQNRLCLMEPHYALPLLSVVPKPIAHVYIRLFRTQKFYYENLLLLGQLKRLVSRFSVVDYTRRIVQDPVRYCATDLLLPGSLKQRIALAVLDVAYFLCPTYVWILVKK